MPHYATVNFIYILFNVIRGIKLTFKHLTCNVVISQPISHYLYFNGDFE
jgi:hypothetical protein